MQERPVQSQREPAFLQIGFAIPGSHTLRVRQVFPARFTVVRSLTDGVFAAAPIAGYIARFSGKGATSTFTPSASNALTCAALIPLSVIR